MRRSPVARLAHRRRATTVAAAVLGAAVVLAVAWRVVGLGGDGVATTSDPGPVHVHALGVNPADDALFIATHTGLFRLGRDDDRARRVGARHQDTMGFTVIGPDRFLGSGHPDLRDDLPSHLGLIQSVDAGRNWDSVALLGAADFHVLRRAGSRVYGYDASSDRLLASRDAGRTWAEHPRPGPILDLAVSPGDRDRILLTSLGGAVAGLFESRDGGRSWARVDERVGLLAWPARDRLYVVTGSGEVLVSAEAGRRLAPRGEIGGQPAALVAGASGELFVALHDGTIKRSVDGGITWTVRSMP